MGIEMWFVHPLYSVHFEISQDFIFSLYEQDKNLIYTNRQKKITHGILSVTSLFTSLYCNFPNSSYLRF